MTRIGSVPVGSWIKFGDHEYKITGKTRTTVSVMDWDGRPWHFSRASLVWVYES